MLEPPRCGRTTQLFDSAAELLKKVASGDVQKCTYKPDPKVEGKKGSWDVPGPDAEHARRAAIDAPEPSVKPRYRLTGAEGGGGRLVSWLGWEFFVTMRPSTGLAHGLTPYPL